MIGAVIPHSKAYKLKTIIPMIQSSGDTVLKLNNDNFFSTNTDFYLHSGIYNITTSLDHLERFKFSQKKPILILDAHVLRMLPNNKNWIRLSWNSIYLDEGLHPYDPTYDRWKYISNKFNLTMNAWNRGGDVILINLQKSTDGALNRLNFNNTPYTEYILNKIIEIRKISNRPIRLRSHPLDTEVRIFLENNLKLDNISFSENSNLYDDFKDTWCMITYNSTSVVESILYGIHTISLDPSSLAWNYGGQSISDIERDLSFDRYEWANRVSFMSWHVDELNNSYLWKILKKTLKG
jgi:hypothetical protein